MSPFRHLLLTRFNVQVPGWVRDRHGNPVRTPEWLDHRFDLFERFCLPSVGGQSCGDFEWWVFFDSATPEPYRRRIESCRRLFPFEPIFCDSFEAAQKTIRARTSRESRHLITTRLDNDDALHRDALARVQATFRGQRFEFVNLPRGFSYERWLFPSFTLVGPFVSLIEAPTDEGFTTVWCGHHARVAELGPVRQLDGEALWLRVVHERNLSTRVRPLWRQILRRTARRFVREGGRAPLGFADVAAEFGIDPAAARRTRFH